MSQKLSHSNSIPLSPSSSPSSSSSFPVPIRRGILDLYDGIRLYGIPFGSNTAIAGELVFNTG
jgi:hypothetical protein